MQKRDLLLVVNKYSGYQGSIILASALEPVARCGSGRIARASGMAKEPHHPSLSLVVISLRRGSLTQLLLQAASHGGETRGHHKTKQSELGDSQLWSPRNHPVQ
jgi:hypothetical protein